MNCNQYVLYIQKEIEEKVEYECYKHAFEAYKNDLEKRLVENRQDVEAACQLGAVLLELRESEEKCIQPLEELLIAFQDQLSDLEKVRLHINIAGICEYGKKCRQHLEKAVALNLPIPNGYDALGRIFMEEKEYSRAESLFLKAVQISNEPIYRYNYAVSLYQNQKINEAKKIFEGLYLEKTEDRVVIYGYAVCCYLTGEEERAVELLEKLERTLDGAETILEDDIASLYFLGKTYIENNGLYDFLEKITLYCKDDCYMLDCPRHQKLHE